MDRHVLMDTGPLVALLDRRDRFHDWALDQARRLPSSLLTCEAVLTESSHLVRHLPGGGEAILRMVSRGDLLIPFRLEEEAGAVERLMTRYANVPMSLADACLVRLAELRPGSRILTLDRDFTIYRQHGRRVIPTIRPKEG